MRKTIHLTKIATLTFVITALTTLTSAPAAAPGEGMLYLVEYKATASGGQRTREQVANLLEKLIVPSLEALATSRKVKAGGLFVGARAGAFIVEAGSHDEVTELVRALPAWGFWTWKVRPLESFVHRAELEKKVIQKLRAQTD